MRTSPTNIGFWMVSALAAHDFGYLTVDQAVDKLTRTMETIGKLDRYEGHLLNWYDIETLTPLEPRYVSMVDSGNLLGALWALEHGLDELMQGPMLDAKAFAGLLDTGATLKQIAVQEGVSGLDTRGLDELMRGWEAPPGRIADALRLLRQAGGSVKVLYRKGRKSPGGGAGGEPGGGTGGGTGGEPEGGESGVAYWAGQMEKQVSAWLEITDRYLAWIEILDEKTEDEVARLGLDVSLAVRRDLHHAPSLRDLANGNVGCIQILQSIREAAPSTAGPLFEWIDRLLQAFAKTKWLAGEMLALGERLIKDVRELSESINMRFLYDSERRLFSIGYNVSEGRLDSAYYDLLASEARLGSFAAIARGDVSAEHWFSMSRPYGSIGRRRVLLSWTGSMFEYLMPLILQKSHWNSLLDKATREAVASHIAYGRKRHVPWGISESAFGDLDINKTYQYKALIKTRLGGGRRSALCHSSGGEHSAERDRAESETPG